MAYTIIQESTKHRHGISQGVAGNCHTLTLDEMPVHTHSFELWSASSYNTFVDDTLDEIYGRRKEFTCEFCIRANPIENCECERCGAPRKAV